MRIGIDVRYLSHGLLGGVHTYVRELTVALCGIAHDHEIFLYADGKRPFELTGLPAHVRLRVLPWRSPLSSIVNDATMRGLMARDAVDVAHFPANYGVGPNGAATVVTVHDAINLLPLRKTWQSPDSVQTARSRVTTAYLTWWTRRSARHATVIQTISEYSRREIARIGGVPVDRIIAIPSGAPALVPSLDPEQQLAIRRRLELDQGFVLADALKNPEAIVKAWGLLSPAMRADRTILFFARHRTLLPVVAEAIRTGIARVIHRPSADDLAALYGMADAFVFPSWIEGFGLPALEAMAFGSPLICSNRGALPEVVGDAALLHEPDDAVALARHLESVLGQPTVAEDLRHRGRTRAKSFSWTTSARLLLDCYRAAVESRR